MASPARVIQEQDLPQLVRELRLELKAIQAERASAMAEIRQLTLARDDAERKQQHAEKLMAAERLESKQRLEAQASRCAQLEQRMSGVQAELDALQNAVNAERIVRAQLEASLSWKVTAPLRAIMRSIRALSR